MLTFIFFFIQSANAAELHFPSGARYSVEERLGGNVSSVYVLDESRVIRVPRTRGNQDMLQWYHDGYSRLEQEGVPLPRVDFKASNRDEFIIQERIYPRAKLNELALLSEEERAQAEKALVTFAIKTAQFEWIGDFKPEQLVWDGERWVLVDWTNSHILYSPLNWLRGRDLRLTNTLFAKLSELPANLQREISQAIGARREQLACNTLLETPSIQPRPLMDQLF